jgi:hypothetical protein
MQQSKNKETDSGARRFNGVTGHVLDFGADRARCAPPVLRTYGTAERPFCTGRALSATVAAEATKAIDAMLDGDRLCREAAGRALSGTTAGAFAKSLTRTKRG